MKKILFPVVAFMMMSFTSWQTNFDEALQIAKERHQVLLLNFSGSDWCGPCMRMHREIFENAEFSKWADSSLVLYNADFPRNKKSQPDASKKKQNESLADKYNPDGIFPFTLLLNDDGTIIKSWAGFPKDGADTFVKEVKSVTNAH